MKYDLCPVIDAYDIEEELSKKYPGFGNLPNLMWPGDFMNDSYKGLTFKEPDGSLVQEEVYDEDDKETYLRNLVYAYLYEIFPEFSFVLVEISW